MYYFYVLQSKKTGQLYLGFTENLKKRLSEHNNHKVNSTRNLDPLDLIYYEAYRSIDDAKHREYSIKLRGNAYGQLKRRIKSSLNKI